MKGGRSLGHGAVREADDGASIYLRRHRFKEAHAGGFTLRIEGEGVNATTCLDDREALALAVLLIQYAHHLRAGG